MSVIVLLTEVQLLVQVLIPLISKVVVCGTLLLRSHPECQCYVQPIWQPGRPLVMGRRCYWTSCNGEVGRDMAGRPLLVHQ